MKIKVKEDQIIFVPENELDIFDIGKISTKSHPYVLSVNIKDKKINEIGISIDVLIKFILKGII